MATLPFLLVVDSSFCLKKTGLIEPREAPERSPGTPRESQGPLWEDLGSMIEVNFQTNSYGDVASFMDSFVKLIDFFVELPASQPPSLQSPSGLGGMREA